MMPTIITPAFQEELQERGAILMTEGQAILELARCLGRYEDATGQRLAVVDAMQVQADATITMPMAETITDPEPVADVDGDVIEMVEPPAVATPSQRPIAQPSPTPVPDPLPLVEQDEPAALPEAVILETVAPEPPPVDVAHPPAAPWSSEEEGAAMSMQAKGFSPSHIAKVLRRPLRQIQPLLATLGSQAPEPAPPVAPPAFPNLTGRQQRLVDHVGRLPDTFEPADDLWLVESFAKGVAIGVIADQLGCDILAVRSRFKAMMTDEITTPKGMITIDGQADLLVALRYRAGD